MFVSIDRNLWLILSRLQVYDGVSRSTRGRIEWREIVAQATTFDADSSAEMNVYVTLADAVYRRDALSVRAKVAAVLAAGDIAGRAMPAVLGALR